MNWLNRLLGRPGAGDASKPAAKVGPAARRAEGAARGPATGKPPPPPARPSDAAIEMLRQAMAAASGDEERHAAMASLGRALAQSQRAPGPDDPAGVIAAAACEAQDRALAHAWAGRVEDEASFAAIALGARFADVRLAAARRLKDGALLERVARGSRERDKGVYRLCADELQGRRDAERRAQRATHLAASLRELLAAVPLVVSRLIELERELRAVDDGTAALDECRELIAHANARVRAETEDQRSAHAQLAEANALAAACASAESVDEPGFTLLRARACALARDIESVPGWLATQATTRSARERLAAIEARLDNLTERRATPAPPDPVAAVPAVADVEADSAPSAPSAPAAAAARAATEEVIAEAPAIPPPATADARSERAAVAARPRPRRDAETIVRQLDQFERALDEGHLAQATAAADRIETLLRDGTAPASVAARVQRALGRLAQLRDWAQWGTAQKREELVAAAEALLAVPAPEPGSSASNAPPAPDLEHLAKAVSALREAWKRLGGPPGSGHAQWQRFDAALEKAYAPVAAHLEMARAQKDAICARWEGLLPAAAREADLAALESMRQSLVAEWRAAPAAGFRDERALRRRLEKLLQPIDARLETGRADERRRREALIVAAQALAAAADSATSLNEARALQEQWRAPGGARLPRGEDQKTWQRFRAACDAVFARRDARRAEQVAQREQRERELREELDRLERIAAGDDAQAIAAALKQLQDLAKSGTERSRAAASGAMAPGDHARGLVRKLQQRSAELQAARRRDELARMAEAAASAEGVDEATLETGRGLRAALLLDLEIALGLASPPEAAEARRARQLAKLQRRFGSAAAPVEAADPHMLLRRWYATPAPADPAQERRFAAVVERLVSAPAAGPSA